MKKINIIGLLLMLTVAITSCSKWDDFKQYTASGETIYTGKMDSAKVYSGRLRVKITGLLSADPKITKTKITWNSGNDSVIYNISKGVGIDSFNEIITVPEGAINFSIQNFDAVGNGSIIVNVTGVAYGPKYESSLNNRPVATAELQTSGNTIITWDAFDTTTGAKGTWVGFTKTNNAADSVFVPVGEAVTTIADLKAGTPVTLRTKYLPTPTTIDTFYSQVETKSVKADITTVYLSNTGPGFQRDAFDGRFGTLAAPGLQMMQQKIKAVCTEAIRLMKAVL